jgi:heme exporter protein B
VREVDGHTMTFLRLVASPTAIALGKLLFNLLFLVLLEIVIVPVYLLLMGGPAPAWGPFLALLGLGSLALSAATTLIGALIAQTRGRGALFAGVSIPVLLPIFAAAVSGTRGQWEGVAVDGELRLLLAYAVAMLALGLLLYDHLWED